MKIVARLALLVGVAVSLLAGCACGSATTADLTGVAPRHPDKIEAYVNIDGHPNVVRLCIDKVAFATTTREYGNALTRVPEWDVSFCGATVVAK